MVTRMPLPEKNPSHQWNLVASSGRERLGGSFVGHASDEDGLDLVLASLSVVGRFWRSPPFEDEAENSSERLVTVFSVMLPQVLLRRDRIEYLISELAEWLKKPKEISVELSKSKSVYQSLAISLGIREDLICSLDRPACTIAYSANSFEIGKWKFIVDQSCIRIFFEELRTSLDLARSAS
jgi:hypothetical protein